MSMYEDDLYSEMLCMYEKQGMLTREIVNKSIMLSNLWSLEEAVTDINKKMDEPGADCWFISSELHDKYSKINELMDSILSDNISMNYQMELGLKFSQAK